MAVIIFLVIHILLCLLTWLLLKAGILRASSMVVVLAFLVPVWGFACLFFLELRARGDGEVDEQVGIEKLKINDEIYRSILIDEDPMDHIFQNDKGFIN